MDIYDLLPGIVDQITCEADSQQAPKRRKLFCSTPVSANYHTKASSGGSKTKQLYQKLLQRQLDIIDLKGRKLTLECALLKKKLNA